MNTAIDFEAIIPKFDKILERGLCAGVGTRDGRMCIEAAICAALDLPHGDNPSCVTPAIRSYKIALNDARWSSPRARAVGLRDLGIAQIGSAGVVDGAEFRERLAEKTIRVLIPELFREVLHDDPACMKAADLCEREGTKAATRAAARAATWVAAEAAWAAEAAAEATWVAAGAAWAAWGKGTPQDKYLLLSAKLALETLRELDSPGVRFI